ncbi:MAG: succinylglutamate desuccinylase/aspartoacylase family protein, partial [Candidatus Baltobacteraceae bacterium]
MFERLGTALRVQPYDDLEAGWKALRRSRDISVREVACIGAPRTLLCAEVGSTSAPTVAIAAGVHGDEPAAAWALLSLVEDGLLDPLFSYRLWPCNNPTGYRAGTRENAEGDDVNRSFTRGGQTPEAKAIMTANRDRKFVLSLDLHEDNEAEGFYCYCYEPTEVGSPIGTRVVESIAAAGLPLQALTHEFNLGAPLQTTQVTLTAGRVIPNLAAEMAGLGGLSYSLYVIRHAARRA